MVFSSADRRAGNFRTLGEWRGPKAPPAPEQAGTLTGRVETIEIDSPNLGEKRKVEVYLPPGHTLQTRYPIIYMADGRTVEHYAKMLEPLIASRKVPPLILAGLRAGQGNPVPGDTVGRRAAEYLFGRVKGDAFFLKHESFFLGEVIPEMERRFAASPEAKDRVVLGQSNGASWAIDMALRHPAQFSRVIGFSPCWAAGYRKWDAAKPKLFLTAGIFEQTCAETVAASAQAAKTAGQDVTFETHASGHSGLMWDVQFIDALSWAYPAR
jgi:enterochelin esterase-like enzyme